MNEKLLAAAFLWLLNHYEQKNRLFERDVVRRAEAILKHYHPTSEDYKQLIKWWKDQ